MLNEIIGLPSPLPDPRATANAGTGPARWRAVASKHQSGVRSLLDRDVHRPPGSLVVVFDRRARASGRSSAPRLPGRSR